MPKKTYISRAAILAYVLATVLTVDDRDAEIGLDDGSEVKATGGCLLGVSQDNVDVFVLLAGEEPKCRDGAAACDHCKGARRCSLSGILYAAYLNPVKKKNLTDIWEDRPGCEQKQLVVMTVILVIMLLGLGMRNSVAVSVYPDP